MGIRDALAICGMGGLGALAGAAARLLLGRLRRGVPVPVGPCEVAVALLWSVTGAAWLLGRSPGAWAPALLGLGWLAVAAGLVDARRRRLPDALTLPALPVGLLLLAPLGATAVRRGLAGAALAVAVYGAGHLLCRGGLGAGDVKLAAPLGAVLAAVSWPALLAAAVLAAVLSAGAALTSAGRARRVPPGVPDGRAPPWWRTAVPHGPAMLAAAWLVGTVAVAGVPLGGAGGR